MPSEEVYFATAFTMVHLLSKFSLAGMVEDLNEVDVVLKAE
ncbi:MAG: hypothetical protein WC364_00410 [Eubacteriales bacterium]|jgi:hypothetical protein